MPRRETIGGGSASRCAVDTDLVDAKSIEQSRGRIGLLRRRAANLERSAQVSGPGPSDYTKPAAPDRGSDERDLVETAGRAVHPQDRRTFARAEILDRTDRGLRDGTVRSVLG